MVAESRTEEEQCKRSHEICRLKVLDQQGALAGVLVVDGATYDANFNDSLSLQEAFAFAKVLRTTLSVADDPAWDLKSRGFVGQPGQSGINPESDVFPLDLEFDQEVYDLNVCWCVYNILIVTFEEGVAYRVTIGRVYHTAFDEANPDRKISSLG